MAGPFHVELALVPALRLRPGRAVMARVVSLAGSGRGTLAIAGAVIEAALPPGVHPGQELRLLVRHCDEQRVVFEVPSDGEEAPGADSGAGPSFDFYA